MSTDRDAARLAAILSSVDGIVWEADAETLRFTYVGGRVERVVGYTPAEWLASPTFWRDHLHPDEREATVEACVALTAQLADHELVYRFRASDGQWVWLRDLVTVIVDDGRASRICGVMVDVTAQKDAEALRQRLRESQKMEAIGRLAGGVAHEFNNALVAVLLEAELGEGIEGLPESATRAFRTIRVAAERASALTQQLLVFGRQQVLRTEDLALDAAVARQVRVLARVLDDEVDVVLDLGAGDTAVHADASLVDQLVRHLVLNAADAMPRGGVVRVETRQRALDAETLRARRPEAAPGPWVALTVRDAGEGVSDDDLPHLFEPFFAARGHTAGQGLGLALVHGIVDAHGGFVDVETAPGAGTAIHVLLPALEAPSGALPVRSASIGPSRGAGEEATVLLAEDDPLVRRALRRVLAGEGFRVLEAGDGPSAVALFEAHGDEITLLLTDLVMPGGMSGLDLAQELLSRRPDLGVVYTSGYSPEIAGKELGPDELFLQKPFTPRDVVAILRRCLRGA